MLGEVRRKPPGAGPAIAKNQVRRIGMLTPSCNIVLEPLTYAMLAGFPGVSAHFARFRVQEISLEPEALEQFADGPMLQAANLLATAKVDIIAWNGTSGGWLGFDRDTALCEAITRETGIPAISSALAIKSIFERLQVSRFGLVTPYDSDVQARITEVFGKAGFACVAEEHLGLTDGYAYGLVGEQEIEGMLTRVSAARPDASLVLCTNMRGAPLATRLKVATAVPVVDSLAATVWNCLDMLGLDTDAFAPWGNFYRSPQKAAG